MRTSRRTGQKRGLQFLSCIIAVMMAFGTLGLSAVAEETTTPPQTTAAGTTVAGTSAETTASAVTTAATVAATSPASGTTPAVTTPAAATTPAVTTPVTTERKPEVSVEEQREVQEEKPATAKRNANKMLTAATVNGVEINTKKTATIANAANRTYQIDLEAFTNKATSKLPYDIVLVLDSSGSMDYDSTEAIYNYKCTVDDLWKVDWNTYYYQESPGNYKKAETRSGHWGDDRYDAAGNKLPGSCKLYEQQGYKTRMELLQEAATSFVDTVRSTSVNSKICVVSFADNPYNLTNGFLPVSNAGITNAISSLNADGGTRIDSGLAEAKNALNKSTNANKLVIVFSDGVPEGNPNNRTVANNAVTNATEIKKTATIYSIGLFSDSNEKIPFGDNNNNKITVTDFMTRLASKPENYYSANASNLNASFQEIATKMEGGVKDATIKDVLDPRFEVVGTPAGATLSSETINGNVCQVVTWTGQNIPAIASGDTTTPRWTKSFTIKAKDAFIGGNNITTNGAESGIYQSVAKLVGFEQPTVNVPVRFTVGSVTQNIFYGDTVPEGPVKASIFDDVNLKNGTTAVGFITGQTTGTFSQKWFYDAACTKPVGVNGTVDELKALAPSQPSNVYTLAVTFTPTGNGTTVFNGAAGGGAAVTTIVAKGTYTVNVTKGTITVTKNINKSQTWLPHGDPIFTFKLERMDGGKVVETKYGSVRFSNADTATQSIGFAGLKKGTYVVTELDALRYTPQTKSVNITIGSSNPNGTATFNNNKITDKYFSHTDVVVNTFTINWHPAA